VSQLDLRVSHSTLANVLRRRVRDVVDYVGVKEFAFHVDASPSRLSNGIDERDRHRPLMSWLPTAVILAPDDGVVEEIASWRGLTVAAEKPRSPEQELADLKETLSEMLAPEMRAVVLQRAKRRSR
jgi:hypothetical protein